MVRYYMGEYSACLNAKEDDSRPGSGTYLMLSIQ